MSMYLDDIAARQFVVSQEGYDREEVRAFLEIVARNQKALQDEIESLRDERTSGEDVGGEIASLLRNAREMADRTLHEAREEAQAIRLRAEKDAETLRQATIDASDRAREEADLYAFETRAAADKELRERLRETNERIDALLSGATTVRDRLFGVDAILMSVRDEVAAATEALEGVGAGVEKAELPPPPPPRVIDLSDMGSNGSRVAADA
jgi:DivIVA domain-containing protein